jgi:hypothetical protein
MEETMRWFLVGPVACVALAGPAVSAPARIPDLSGFWQHTPIAEYEAVPNHPGPVFDRKHPLSPTNFQVALEGNHDNPILQPWAAAEVKRRADAANAGKPLPTPQEVCQHSGVPNVITLPAPVLFIQQPHQVLILYQRDHQVRRIHMDVPHSPNHKLSWYGESVGRYEGDTLVVDTIRMNDKTPVDIFGTPHTTALHVVERYRLIDGGKQLEVVFTVDDAGAFTTQWTARMVYGRSNARELTEEVCAENNLDVVTKEIYPIPTATTPDF